MSEITVTSITQRDIERKQIRILANQKELFPTEQRGFPKIYDITVICEYTVYDCTYKIGSKDGKARSGVLRLKGGLEEALGNTVGKVFVFKWTGNNQYHLTSARI
ncbi:hypothetical protein SAMN05428949_2502 [Chitinophaga sp. YR627]|nr:hypothetical protein SAMN05428949_2502 [Chitinophaga sp. YR627]